MSTDNTRAPSFFDGIGYRDFYTSVGGSYIEQLLAADYSVQLALSQAIAVPVSGSLVTSGNFYVGLMEGFGTLLNNATSARTVGWELRLVRTFDAGTQVAQSGQSVISAGNSIAFQVMAGVGTPGLVAGAQFAKFVVQLYLIALSGVAGDVVLKSSLTWSTNPVIAGVRLRLWPQYQGVVNV